MESLSWLKNFAGTRLRSTRKLYYDRFGYRLELCVSSARWLNLARSTVIGSISQTDAQVLGMVSALKKSKDSTDIRLRTEGNCVQIYTETAVRLRKIIESLSAKVGAKAFRGYVNDISLPEDPDALAPGVKFVNDPDFKYQARIKTDRKTRRNHDQIKNYLENLDPGTVRILCSNVEMTIRLNDLSCLTFLELISPGCVGKIYELVQRPR